MDDILKQLIKNVPAKVLVDTVEQLQTENKSLKEELTLLNKDLGNEMEKVSNAYAELKHSEDNYSRSQNRVGFLYNMVEKIAKSINQDCDEVDDGTVIDEIVDVLTDEFESTDNGTFIFRTDKKQ